MASVSATLLDRYMTALLAGNRIACRDLIASEAFQAYTAEEVYREILWPAMERVEKHYRTDRINAACEHMAARINRAVADQVQLRLTRCEPTGKRMLIACAEGEPEELGAQMCADLFEADGWDVFFVGGGVPHDELLSLVGQLRPDVLLVFGTQPTGVPGVRRLIDLIREVGATPTMNVMVSGGVFNRADGLWKEIDADLFAKTAHEAIPVAEAALPRTPRMKVPGAPKKRRRRRRAVAVAGTDKA
jgi:methanogenic corrinoid protein MtbC1